METSETVELKSHRILIVDDQRALRLPMKHLLKSLGQEVVEASDGTAALETAEQIRPEIILCDIGLTDIDGYAVVRSGLHDRMHPLGLLCAMEHSGKDMGLSLSWFAVQFSWGNPARPSSQTSGTQGR